MIEMGEKMSKICDFFFIPEHATAIDICHQRVLNQVVATKGNLAVLS